LLPRLLDTSSSPIWLIYAWHCSSCRQWRRLWDHWSLGRRQVHATARIGEPV
jgi:hypothetical protein